MREMNMRKAVVGVLLSVACCGLVASSVSGGGMEYLELKTATLLPGTGVSASDLFDGREYDSFMLVGKFNGDSLRTYVDVTWDAITFTCIDSNTVDGTPGTTPNYVTAEQYAQKFTAGGTSTTFPDAWMWPLWRLRALNLNSDTSPAAGDTVTSLVLRLYGKDH